MKRAEDILSHLLKFKSFTPAYSGDASGETIEKIRTTHFKECMSALLYLNKIAKEYNIKTTRLNMSNGSVKWPYTVPNQFFDWGPKDADIHICFMGHIDVVPLGNSDEWTIDPFGAEVKDGYMYGRGATDMKGAVAAFFAAWFEVIHQRIPNIRISAIITGDEEWAAVNGSVKVLEWMKAHNITPHFFLVGEPSSSTELGTHVKCGRRGSFNGEMHITGVQNHVANVNYGDNAATIALEAGHYLNQLQFNDGDHRIKNTNFEITKIEADGGSTSIVPGSAVIRWNFRHTPFYKPEELVALMEGRLLTHLSGGYWDRVEIKPNYEGAQAPYMNDADDFLDIIRVAYDNSCGGEPTVDAHGGVTDGRFVHQFFPKAQVLELGPPENGGVEAHHDDYMKKGGMHQVNERINLDDLYGLAALYEQILIQCSEYENMID